MKKQKNKKKNNSKKKEEESLKNLQIPIITPFTKFSNIKEIMNSLWP